MAPISVLYDADGIRQYRAPTALTLIAAVQDAIKDEPGSCTWMSHPLDRSVIVVFDHYGKTIAHINCLI